MTDKHIIDGVNVAECEFYNADDETCREENSKYPIDTCEFAKCRNCNCNYKRLKRAKNQIVDLNKMVEAKEQECERLKYENGYEVGALEKTIDNLKAEYEKLSKECEIWKNQVLTIDDEAITIQITQQQFEDYNQLKAEKEEIKEYLGISSKTIMERLEELQEFRDNDKYKLCQAEQTLTEIKGICRFNFTMATTNLLAKTILQKISEYEVENENRRRNQKKIKMAYKSPR